MRVILNLEDKMTGYLTAQKKTLLGFLKKNSERAFTVEELTEGIKKAMPSDAPGKSTVYRLITKFVEDGTVRRFVKGKSRKFVYQIVNGEKCDFHLHLRCTDCGRLVHLDDTKSAELIKRIKKLCSFSVDQSETVLMGLCSECEKNKS